MSRMAWRGRWWRVALCLGFIVTLLVAGCAKPPQPAAPAAAPIKIGIGGPMAFIHGEHTWKAATMAMEEVNAAGGVQVGGQKRPVELVKIDTNEILSVPDAASAVERAITADKIDFLIAGFRTEATLAMQDVAMDHKKIHLSIGAIHPELTAKVARDYNRYKYYFRANPFNSTYVGRVLFLMLKDVGDIVRQELGIEKPKVAVLVEKVLGFDPVADAAPKAIPGMGMEVVGVWRPSATATDLTAELSAIRAAGAHIIFTALSGPVGVVYARQWEELQVPAASVGANVEGMGGPFWKATGGKGNYEATINFIGQAAVTEKTIPFFEKFIARFGEVPLYLTATYDAVLLLAEAIERAGTLDSDAVVAELEKTDYRAVHGRIVFTKEHDLTWGPKFVTGLGTQWQDGKMVVFWPNGWEGIKYEGTVRYALPPWMVSHWKK